MNQKINIVITRIANPSGHPNILCQIYSRPFENQVLFRKAMKKGIELTEQTDTKGIQVQIPGCLDRKEIALSVWLKEGRVPLQTIGDEIDY